MDFEPLLSVIITSVPEAFLFCIIGILAIGKFEYLKNKRHLIRILLVAAVISFVLYFLRRLNINIIELLSVDIFVYSLLFIFVLRLNFYESILAAIFTMISAVLVEALSAEPTIMISGFKDVTIPHSQYILLHKTNRFIDFISMPSDFHRFIVTLPERIIQLMLIYLSVKFNIRIVDFESKNVKKKEYYVQLFAYILTTLTLVFIITVILKVLIFDKGNLRNSLNEMLMRINIYITVFLTIILLLAVKSTSDFYKKKNMLSNNEILQSLEYISDLIKDESYIEARESINNLKEHLQQKEDSLKR